MYEGLSLVGEKELLDSVTSVREQLEEELIKDQSSQLSVEAKEFHPRELIGMQRIRGIDEVEEMIIHYDPMRENQIMRGEGFEEILRLNHPDNVFRVPNPFNPMIPPAIIQENPFNIHYGAYIGNLMG